MRHNTIDLSIIAQVVCDYFKLSVTEMLNKTRKKDIINARQWFQYLSRDLNPLFIVSCSDIGAYLSDFTNHKYDHATVLYSQKTLQGYIDICRTDAEINIELRKRIKECVDGQTCLNNLVPQKIDLLSLTEAHTRLQIN